MAVIKTECVDCGKRLDESVLYLGYDDITRCKKCDLENELCNLLDRYENKLLWLKNRVKDLRKTRSQIKQVKNELNALV